MHPLAKTKTAHVPTASYTPKVRTNFTLSGSALPSHLPQRLLLHDTNRLAIRLKLFCGIYRFNLAHIPNFMA